MDLIEDVEYSKSHGNSDSLWNIAREAPRYVAQNNGERVVQMIDKFQFINRYIFWDKEKKRQAKDLAGSYLHTCEYKNAPMLVSGSWVGWLMDDLPEDFEFEEYDRIWSYTPPPLHEPEFQVDLFARAGKGGYSLVGEVKNRKAKFSVKEARHFMEKVEELKKLESIDKSVSCIFSFGGFFKNTLEFLKKNGIAWSDDARWLEKSRFSKSRPGQV